MKLGESTDKVLQAVAAIRGAKDALPIGAKYAATIYALEKGHADMLLSACVDHTMRTIPGLTRQKALQIERESIAYFAGYYSHDVRIRVEELFDCVHPYFGPASAGPPEPNVAFQIGQAAASGLASKATQLDHDVPKSLEETVRHKVEVQYGKDDE